MTQLEVGDVVDFQFDGRDLDTDEAVPAFADCGVVEIISKSGALVRYAEDCHVWLPRVDWTRNVQRRGA